MFSSSDCAKFISSSNCAVIQSILYLLSLRLKFAEKFSCQYRVGVIQRSVSVFPVFLSVEDCDTELWKRYHEIDHDELFG